MAKQVTLSIDGIVVSVPEGTLIVNAAKKAGIDIPVFCYHPKMEPVGMCRMCLVEIGRPVVDRASGEMVKEADGSPKIQFSLKLETACTTPVSEGMVVLGASEKVKAGRMAILEFLLTSHPLDCPVCDKGGECPLQDLTMGYGPGQSRYRYDEKMHLAKMVALGELIYLDRERCIQCARCVRFQTDIAGDDVIGFYQRGRALEIISYSEPGFDSVFSGNTTDICPVGALTTTDFRFGARPWELSSAASICSQCPVGCNIIFNVRREAASGGKWVIKRVMPRQNEAVNEIWICDKGRFAYHYTASPDRLTQPLVRKDGRLVESTWDEALDLVASRLQRAGQDLLTLVSGRLTNEDLFNINKVTCALGGKAVLYGDMAGGDLTTQVGVGAGTNFADLGSETTIVAAAGDLEQEAPVWHLRIKQAVQRGAKLIILNPRFTKLERYASHVLRYAYGEEAAFILAMTNALSAKRIALNKLTYDRGIKDAAKTIAEAENVVILFGSEGLGFEGSQSLAQACANLLLVTNHIGRANNGLIGVWQRVNDQGAWDMGFRPVADLKSAMQSARVLYVAAADPAGDFPDLAETADFLVVQDLFLTATARLADVVLPAQAFTEREGSYTSGERRIQRFYPALPPLIDCLPDFSIAARLGKRLGIDLEEHLARRVMDRIAAGLADYNDIDYAKLAQVSEQLPVVGRGDMYYGGAAYENTQGLGVQLIPAAQRGEQVSLRGMQPGEAVKPADSLWAVPITRLYDRGQTVMPSSLLHKRIPHPYVAINPEDAEKSRIGEGDTMEVVLNDICTLVNAQLDSQIPRGIVLVPRSMGIPITAPAVAKIKNAQKLLA